MADEFERTKLRLDSTEDSEFSQRVEKLIRPVFKSFLTVAPAKVMGPVGIVNQMKKRIQNNAKLWLDPDCMIDILLDPQLYWGVFGEGMILPVDLVLRAVVAERLLLPLLRRSSAAGGGDVILCGGAGREVTALHSLLDPALVGTKRLRNHSWGEFYRWASAFWRLITQRCYASGHGEGPIRNMRRRAPPRSGRPRTEEQRDFSFGEKLRGLSGQGLGAPSIPQRHAGRPKFSVIVAAELGKGCAEGHR